MRQLNELTREELISLIPLNLYKTIGPKYFTNKTNKEIATAIMMNNYNKQIKKSANSADVNITNYYIPTYDLEGFSQKKFYELLDYQFYIKSRAMKRLRTDKRFIIHMPTGTGKTKVTSHILSEYLNVTNNPKVLWVAHENILLEQGYNEFTFTWERLKRKNINIKMLDNDFNLSPNEVVFISYQMLFNLKKNGIRINPSLIILDECHKSTATTYHEGILYALDENTQLLGLTATPGRSRNNEIENIRLSDFFDNNKIEFDIELIKSFSWDEFKATKTMDYLFERQILSRPNFKNINFELDVNLAHSMNEKQLSDYISNLESRNKIIISECKKEYDNGRKIMVFASSIDHADALNFMFSLEGIVTSIVHGKITDKENDENIKKFLKNAAKILIVVDKLTTGFDDPQIDCVYIARNTTSIVLFSQMLGRGLRGKVMGGTEDCVVYKDDSILLFEELDNIFSYFDIHFREDNGNE